MVVAIVALGLDPASLNGKGMLAGIVSADGLLEFLAEEMGDLPRISGNQQVHEKRARH